MRRDHRRHPANPAIQAALGIAAALAFSICIWIAIVIAFITF